MPNFYLDRLSMVSSCSTVYHVFCPAYIALTCKHGNAGEWLWLAEQRNFILSSGMTFGWKSLAPLIGLMWIYTGFIQQAKRNLLRFLRYLIKSSVLLLPWTVILNMLLYIILLHVSSVP